MKNEHDDGFGIVFGLVLVYLVVLMLALGGIFKDSGDHSVNFMPELDFAKATVIDCNE